MNTTSKKTQKVKASKTFKKKKVAYSDLPDLSKDPFFVKKNEDAKKFLEDVIRRFA